MPALVKLPGAEEPFPCNCENGDALGREDGLQKPNDLLSMGWSGQAVRDFGQNVVRRDIVGSPRKEVLVQFNRLLMEGVTFVGQSQPGGCVYKDS